MIPAAVVANLTKVEQIEDIHDLMMWSHEEELIAVNHPGLLRTTMSGPWRTVALFAAAASAVFALTQALRGTMKSALGTAAFKGDDKYMV